MKPPRRQPEGLRIRVAFAGTNNTPTLATAIAMSSENANSRNDVGWPVDCTAREGRRMDIQGIRCAIAAAPRDRLPTFRAMINQAFCSEAITEAQYVELSGLCDIVQVGVAPQPRRSRNGSRPRTPESMIRRRQLSSTGEIPTAIAGRFTQAERAVLQVITREVSRGGECRLCHEKVAALAGVSKTTVKRTIREARALGLITVEQRKTGHRRNDPSIIRIVSPEWLASMRLSKPGRAIAARGLILAANRGQFAPPTSDSEDMENYGERFGLLKRDAFGRMRREVELRSAF